MNYAIIAAGEGSRLRQEGFEHPKPMVSLCGERLVERLIRIFKANKAERITVIINAHSEELEAFLNELKQREPLLDVIVKTTPSSAHSFYAILERLDFEDKPLCLTTVDSIFDEKVFGDYIREFLSDTETDALMAATSYVDDEKPLWINADSGGRILGYSSVQESEQALISGGIYCFRHRAIEVAKEAMELGVSRMRNYQQMLVEEGCNVRAFQFGKVLDIDHVGDIEKAKEFLNLQKQRVLCIERALRYSPTCEERDKRLFDAIVSGLQNRGIKVSAVNEDDLTALQLESADIILSMARSERAVNMLSLAEQGGKTVINSTKGTKNCFRKQMNILLEQSGVAVPKFACLSTKDALAECALENQNSQVPLLSFGKDGELSKNLWVKRADFQTETKMDVVLCRSRQELLSVLQSMDERGIDEVVICENICGRLVKVYRISETDFMEYLFPSGNKFGQKLESVGNMPQADKAKLEAIADKTASVLGLEVFGLDLIEDEKGNLFVIDVNDFPSFANFAPAAAECIADKILERCRQTKR